MSVSHAQEVYLNEIMASNATTIFDEDGDAADWIELYNAGSDPVSLEGYGLSDDYDQPFRWTFPDTSIHPGEFLLVWASGKDRSNPGSLLHANFSISSAGEELIITAPDGTRIDELTPTAIPTDVSIGRQPDGTGHWHFFQTPTPGAANTTEGFLELLEPVIFSHSGGFYTESFLLTLNHVDPDVTIVYTLDGSETDPDNLEAQAYQYKDRYRRESSDPDGSLLDMFYQSHIYTDSIKILDRSSEENRISRRHTTFDNNEVPHYYPSQEISKATVIRAKAIKNGALPSAETIHSFFVSPESRYRFSLPVVSLSIQEDYLFDYEKGFYVPGKIYDEWRSSAPQTVIPGNATPANYRERGIEWEYPAYIELFEIGSNAAAMKQGIGVRIHGGASRADPMKSLRLYARNMYGSSRFNHHVFPDLSYSAYNRLLLRNSGADRPFTMFRDAAIQAVVEHMKFEVQAYRPVIVFINGEYWGIHNFRERYDSHYFSRVYGIDPGNVDILTGNAIIKEGSNEHYLETINYINLNRLVKEQHYEYVKARIDVDNFIDYQIAQIYAGNTDWPGNNIDFWRSRTDEYQSHAPSSHDGRWRWLVYDTDYGFGLHGPGMFPDHNTLKFATDSTQTAWPNPAWSTLLLRRFLENETFRHSFINRFADQLNTAFRPDRVHSIINKMSGILEPEIAEHAARWAQPLSQSEWNSNVNIMREYTAERPEYVREHIRRYFEIQSQVELTIDVEDPSTGRIFVNTIELAPTTPGVDPDPFPWTGIYYHNIPVTLNAQPWPGYIFSHWQGADIDEPNSAKVELRLTEPTAVTAVFVEDEGVDLFPQPFKLSKGSYLFDEWPADAPAGSHPDNMAFVYMDYPDPGLDAEIEGFTYGPFDLDSRTRINGLGENGFAFINTGNEAGNWGYPGTRLGGAILALNTQGKKDIDVIWEGITVQPNSRVCNLRLQYRVGIEGPFFDVQDKNGNPVEYLRNELTGHREQIGPIRLPPELDNKAYVELLWRYYFTGEQVDHESGQRSQMAISSILINPTGDIVGIPDREGNTLPDEHYLHQNYPNPFNLSTQIRFEVPQSGKVELSIFDILGRRIAYLVDDWLNAGIHNIEFNAGELSGGIYIYRLRTENFILSRRMLYLK